jgi:hypothetical protein
MSLQRINGLNAQLNVVSRIDLRAEIGQSHQKRAVVCLEAD